MEDPSSLDNNIDTIESPAAISKDCDDGGIVDNPSATSARSVDEIVLKFNINYARVGVAFHI